MSAAEADTLPDPFALLPLVAAGDLEAMRSMREIALSRMWGPEADPFITITEGLIFARLAAAKGEDQDKGAVISMLAIAAELCPSMEDELLGEAFALAASVDHEEVTARLSNMADGLSLEAIQNAKHYEKRMRGK